MEYSPFQGALIPLKTFNAQHEKWLTLPINRGLQPAFNFDTGIIKVALGNESAVGIKFCNGNDDAGLYAPVICAVSQTGSVLSSFNPLGSIPNKVAETLQKNWVNQKGKEVLRSFYLGRAPLTKFLKTVQASQIIASFMLNEAGQSTGALIAEEAEDVLNLSLPCPPFCG